VKVRTGTINRVNRAASAATLFLAIMHAVAAAVNSIRHRLPSVPRIIDDP